MKPGVMELGDSLVAGGPSWPDVSGGLHLTLTPDGKLQLHDYAGNVGWSPPVGDAQLSSATLTDDGNFAVYTGVLGDRKLAWSTQTAGRGATRMQFTPNGLALLNTDKGSVLWTTNQQQSTQHPGQSAGRTQHASQSTPDTVAILTRPAWDLTHPSIDDYLQFVALHESPATTGHTTETVRIVSIRLQGPSQVQVSYADGSSRTYEADDKLTICQIPWTF